MRAMVLESPKPVDANPLRCIETPKPAAGPGEILIRVRVCGVCHTDLHTVEGDLSLIKQPIIPGHQVVGTVARLGEGVTRFRENDRVGMAWLRSTCGTCTFCETGKENLCEQARFTGYHADGGYAEYSVIQADFAYAIPTRFSDIEAAPLLCAGIIGYRALRLSEIQPGQRLGLYGFGASAHIAIQIARHWGCEVYVFTRGEAHRQLAHKLGAKWTGAARDDPGQKMHSSIIFAPAGALVLDALAILERGGSLALAGIHMSPIPAMDYATHLYYEKKITSVTASTRKDGEELLRIAAEIPIRTETQAFSLEEANQTLQLLKQGKISGAGVLVTN